MKTHHCVQGSEEWLALRLGIPTASEFDALISPLWEIRKGQGPQTYLYGKLTEAILRHQIDDGSSFAMEQGQILEKEAIPFYEFTYDVKIDRVGFCTTDDGRAGCSPDGLIGSDGGIELKCPMPHTHLKYLMEGTLPKDYAAQVHGSMYVTGRPWWMFMSYSRAFPPFVLRVERDDDIQKAIGEALNAFNARFDASMAKIKKIEESFRR